MSRITFLLTFILLCRGLPALEYEFVIVPDATSRQALDQLAHKKCTLPTLAFIDVNERPRNRKTVFSSGFPKLASINVHFFGWDDNSSLIACRGSDRLFITRVGKTGKLIRRFEGKDPTLLDGVGGKGCRIALLSETGTTVFVACSQDSPPDPETLTANVLQMFGPNAHKNVIIGAPLDLHVFEEWTIFGRFLMEGHPGPSDPQFDGKIYQCEPGRRCSSELTSFYDNWVDSAGQVQDPKKH